MWKPDAVVPEHRWRARIVWVSLLVSITAYTVWQIWKILDDLANPSTSLKITNELYAYPYVMVCFFHGEGCGFEDGSTDACVASALIEGFSMVYFDGESFDDLVVETQFSNCVGFDLGSLEFGEDVTAENDQAIVDMLWYATDIASTETDYYDHIGIYMAEEEPTESMLSFLYVPYSRIEPGVGDLTMTHTELTIGKTTKKDLGGDVTTTFPSLVLSSSDFTTENPLTTTTDDDFDDSAFGRLYLDLKQGSYSRTAIAEVDPLDIGTFLGNIGGFWELLLIFWGLFFIATREEREPKMKARDFAKTVQATKEIVTRRRSLSVDAAASTKSGIAEERPHWEPAFRGDNPFHFNTAAAAFPPVVPANDSVGSSAGGGASSTGSRNGSTSNGHRRRTTSGSSDPHGDSSSSNHRRTVAHDVPRRGSKSGGDRLERQRPPPPSYTDMSAV